MKLEWLVGLLAAAGIWMLLEIRGEPAEPITPLPDAVVNIIRSSIAEIEQR